MKYPVRRKEVIKSRSHYLCDYCHFDLHFQILSFKKIQNVVLFLFLKSPSINKSTFRKVILSEKYKS